MGFTEIIAAAGIGLTGAGIATSVSASKDVASAQRDAIAAQQQIEGQRQQQMTLDAARRRREVVRQSIQAQSLATANAAAQGGLQSSGLAGGLGQISGREGTNILGIDQNEQIGNNIFSLNQQVTAASAREASYKANAAIGQGLSSLGGALITNIQPLTMLGNYFTNNRYRSGYVNSGSFGGNGGSYGGGGSSGQW